MRPEEKIYRAYFESKGRPLYFNELKEKTSLSNSSLQNILKDLIKKKMLKIEKNKSNTFYHINDNKIFALKFSEIAVNKFRKLSYEITVPLKEALSHMPKNIHTVLLFGSASDGSHNKDSDIDIMIISDNKIDKQKISEKTDIISNYPLSIFISSIQGYINAKDHVVIQAKKFGFPIMGELNHYEAMLDEINQ